MNLDYQTPLKSEVVRSILEQQQQGLHEGLDGMENPRIMCPTFTTMLIRTIRALCEVNIKFDSKLEISGSLHIRSDGEKVITCLIEEESERPSFARQNSQGAAAGNKVGRERDDLSPDAEDPAAAMQRLPAVSTLLPGSGRGQLSPNSVVGAKEMMPPEVSRALAMAAMPPLPPGLALLANNALLPEALASMNRDHRTELANNVATSIGMEHAQAAALVAHSKGEVTFSEDSLHRMSQNSHSPMMPIMLDKHHHPPAAQAGAVAPPDERALNLSHSVPQDSSPQPGRRESLKSPASPRPSPPTSSASGPMKVKMEPHEAAGLALPPGSLPAGFPMEMLSPNIGVGPAVEVAGSARKKFQCMFCGCFLSTKCYLKNHINAMHTKARAYPCELCEKFFYSAGALRIHKLRNHWQGSKKHKCNHCGEQFLLPIELRRHVSKKHGIEDDVSMEVDGESITTPTTPGELRPPPLHIPMPPGVHVEQQPSEEVPEHVLAAESGASGEATHEQRAPDFRAQEQGVVPLVVPEPEEGPPDVQETVEIPDQ